MSSSKPLLNFGKYAKLADFLALVKLNFYIEILDIDSFFNFYINYLLIFSLDTSRSSPMCHLNSDMEMNKILPHWNDNCYYFLN